MGARKVTDETVGIVPKVRELVLRENCFTRASRVLVMVSGGQDSLALLEILAGGLLGAAGPKVLHGLHVNHHLRGAESDGDEQLVREHCRRLGVTLTVADCPLEKGAGNLMESARGERRNAALKTAEEVGAERIAIGHTLDDQVETMLYRLGRYGGLAAFRSMKACDPPWVRPLLTCRRDETAAFCDARGLAHAVDRGNASPRYARTGIRETVLPAWEAALPGCVEAAGRAAEVAAEMEDLSRWALRELGLEGVMLAGRPGGADYEVETLAALPSSLRRLVLFDALGTMDGLEASRALVLGLERLLGSGGSADLDLGNGWRAHKEYDRLSFVRVGETHPPSADGGATDAATAGRPAAARPGVEAAQAAGGLELSIPGEVEWDGMLVKAERVGSFSAPDPAREAYMDAQALVSPLTVRGPRPGDRLRPLGAGGSRKLQDVLVDLKVPARLRPRVPLVVSEGRIMWVCGMVMAEEGRITRSTTGLVRLSARRAGEGRA